MANTNHREVLERLSEELKQIEPLDERGRLLIDNALTDIHRALDPNDSSLEIDDQSFIEQLQHTVTHFEGTHPNLSSAVTVVIDSLSNMGL